MLSRTPIKTRAASARDNQVVGTGDTDESTKRCKQCTNVTNEQVVGCAKCGDVYHITCAEVAEADQYSDWRCFVCLEKQGAKPKVTTITSMAMEPSVSPENQNPPVSTTSAPLVPIKSGPAINAMVSPNSLFPPLLPNTVLPPHSHMPPNLYIPSHTTPPLPPNRHSNLHVSFCKFDPCNSVPSSSGQPISSALNTVPASFSNAFCTSMDNRKNIPDSDFNKDPTNNKQQGLTDNGSHCSRTSSQRSRKQRQLKLELQILEEERKLQEQEEATKREYLRKRHELMKEMSSESGSIDADIELPEARVATWLQGNGSERHAALSSAGCLQISNLPPLTNVGETLQHQNSSGINVMSKVQRHKEDGRVNCPTLQDSISMATLGLQQMHMHDSNYRPTATQCFRNVSADRAPPRCSTPRMAALDDEEETGLTRNQISARQAVPRELPIFSGNPEEWPLFFSTFTTTTRMCGYTQGENLLRLQKCLKGKAFEAIRCRLMHPSNVPSIMSTLKMLYGNPEVIVQNMITKVYATPSPRTEKLESLIDFSLAVQNLCATIEACELDEYSYNVALLYELVNKLPPAFKVDWAKHRRNLSRANLRDFADWLNELAETVCPIACLHYSEAKPFRGNKHSSYLHTHSEDAFEKPSVEAKEALKSNQTGLQSSRNCVVCKNSCPKLEKCLRFNELGYNSRWAVVKEFELCRKCLRKHKGSCRNQQVCGKNGCTFKHHQLLHNFHRDGLTVNTSGPSEESTQEYIQLPSERECNAHCGFKSIVLFRVVPVVLHGLGRSLKTFAFLDDGSSLTLIDASLARELNFKGKSEPLCLKWTGNNSRREEESLSLNIKISGIEKSHQVYFAEAHTVASLDLFRQTVDAAKLKREFPHLQGIPFDSYRDVQPQILIGSDNANLIFQLQGREGKFHEPIATKTRLGWSIYGGGDVGDSVVNHHTVEICPCQQRSEDSMQQMVRNYFSLDALGIYKPDKLLEAGPDQRAREILQSKVSQTETGRYEVSLLWKFEEFRLPNSKPNALQRFRCLNARMKKHPNLAATLQAKMEDYKQKGYIRKLSNEEIQAKHDRVWYLPLFPVFNPNKPGKVRIVWDAAAETNGVSLNSMLLKGPDLLTPLDYVLYRFREFRVGLSGDVREMYLQMLMSKEDQQCLRVLWCDDSSGEPSIYITQVMPFGTCCSPSCAQYVKNHNATKFAAQYPAASQAIMKQHYVDDMLVSVETEQEAIQLAKDVKHVHAQAGFDMRNWISNSPSVVSAMNEETIQGKSMNVGSELGTEKVLGMWWCTADDTFTYKLSSKHDPSLLEGDRKPTKREVLRTLMAVFDPLGLISNVLIYLKVLFQEVWRSGIGWDEIIPERLYEKWEKWLEILPKVQDVHIPRCYRLSTQLGSQTNIQLHTFVDASLSGYAAVVYLRFEQDSTVECAIVGAKTRVAPLKFVSIPRLELQAAVIGVRLADTISKALSFKVHKRYFWSDSRDVLCWIKSDHRRYSQFVAFRISEILESTAIDEWGHKGSKENVADDATKWQGTPDLSKNSRWFKGPSFLWEATNIWPTNPFVEESTEEELQSRISYHQAESNNVLQVQNYSNWKRLQRTVATILRAVHNFRCMSNKNKQRRTGFLSSNELVVSSNYLYRLAQAEAFSNEITILKRDTEDRSSLPKSSSIHSFNPFIDEQDLLRMRGRISACQYVSMDTKNPIILPKDHHITWLIIQEFHDRYHHQNHATVVNELRQLFKIPKIRRLYQRVRAKCQRCKNNSAVPRPPVMGDLPLARLAAFARPFSYVGVDYFGPMTVVVGRRTEKRWGVLVTCLTVRAIHIEIAHSLNANSCVMALRNFMSRRGVPIQIYSDRGTNFTAANKEMKAASGELNAALKGMNQEHVIAEIASSETEWIFLPPASPHMGGAWERLIQTVKKNLQAMKPGRNPTDEVLRNMLMEIENVVNSHPLTYVPIEDSEAPVLTPNHFLLGSSNGLKPWTLFDDSASALRRSSCMSQIEANIFWQRWLHDYLPDLTKRSKWFSEVKPIEIKDIVVIVDPGLPRNCWPLGRIIAVNAGKDGRVRSAAVQTRAGIYERPVTKLAILDVRRDGLVSQELRVPGGECDDPLVGASHRI
ncbi:uncharacterized protein LOC134204027 [Armigeres subalbatus]|uniref:uncharacterized protein LOC134204027 n=1 Tax=Armigeres subalbatus TaxID=124917 RepID=UPI002ED6A2C6